MKTKNFLTSFCIIILSFTTSCNNEVIDESSPTIEEINEYGSMSFIYKGKTYSGEYHRNNLGISFEQEEISEIWDKLLDIHELAAYVHSDGLIEYFDNLTELKKNNNLERNLKNHSASTRSSSRAISLTVFKDAFLGGKSYTSTLDFSIEDNRGSTHGIGFKDNISSFRITPITYGDKATVTFFRDKNFKGYSITFTSDGTSLIGGGYRVEELSKYYMPNGKNWDNEISSWRFFKSN